MQIQISWLLQKPTDLDLHCLQRQVYPGSAGLGLKYKRSAKIKFPKYIHRGLVKEERVFGENSDDFSYFSIKS